MIVKFEIFINFLFFFLHADTLILEYCPDAQNIPCLQGDDKPKPDKNNHLEITLYYDTFVNGNTDLLVYGNVCKLISNCGNDIRIRLVPGADAEVNKPVNNEILCSGSNCDSARQQICYGFIDEKYLGMCKTPKATTEDMDSCLKNRMNDINTQLLTNSAERKKLEIATCYMPALTFQGKYDGPLCAKYSTYEELKHYVCKEIYNNNLPCCQ